MKKWIIILLLALWLVLPSIGSVVFDTPKSVAEDSYQKDGIMVVAYYRHYPYGRPPIFIDPYPTYPPYYYPYTVLPPPPLFVGCWGFHRR